MSIKNYQNMLIEISNKIIKNQFIHSNSVIIGDNSAGKSELLKKILEQNIDGYYFIDSVNRSFDYEKIAIEDNFENTYSNVLKTRLEENKFNLEDSFDIFKTGIGNIEGIYYNYQDELSKMVEEFLEIDFSINLEQNKIIGDRKKVYINGENSTLSSGYQAIIRIFLELLYFYNNVGKESISKVVVIDEINEFLSVKNEKKIIPFLNDKFPAFKFIVTTHSVDVIASVNDFNIIALGNDIYKILDSNDFNSNTDVREIFENLYGRDEIMENHLEDVLRNLLSLKIMDNWTEKEEQELQNINENELSVTQKLLLKQIKEW